MDVEKICEYCGERKAVTTCEVCGSQVCGQCKLPYGCKVCQGGERRFDGKEEEEEESPLSEVDRT
ncbi:MAG: hypothetical protein ABEJ95_06055 [Candidatus Nanohalobium sp.]